MQVLRNNISCHESALTYNRIAVYVTLYVYIALYRKRERSHRSFVHSKPHTDMKTTKKTIQTLHGTNLRVGSHYLVSSQTRKTKKRDARWRPK